MARGWALGSKANEFESELWRREIVYALAIVKGLDIDAMKPNKRQAFCKSIMKTLKRAEVSGWLVEAHRDQGVIHWRLA